jgi:hypothetical protein
MRGGAHRVDTSLPLLLQGLAVHGAAGRHDRSLLSDELRELEGRLLVVRQVDERVHALEMRRQDEIRQSPRV